MVIVEQRKSVRTQDLPPILEIIGRFHEVKEINKKLGPIIKLLRKEFSLSFSEVQKIVNPLWIEYKTGRSVYDQQSQKPLSYNHYICSKKWKSLRKQVIQRDRVCKNCQQVPTKPHVHHITYIHFGNELLEELELYCEWCHNNLHSK